jgi:hypothetical protein
MTSTSLSRVQTDAAATTQQHVKGMAFSLACRQLCVHTVQVAAASAASCACCPLQREGFTSCVHHVCCETSACLPLLTLLLQDMGFSLFD